MASTLLPRRVLAQGPSAPLTVSRRSSIFLLSSQSAGRLVRLMCLGTSAISHKVAYNRPSAALPRSHLTLPWHRNVYYSAIPSTQSQSASPTSWHACAGINTSPSFLHSQLSFFFSSSFVLIGKTTERGFAAILKASDQLHRTTEFSGRRLYAPGACNFLSPFSTLSTPFGEQDLFSSVVQSLRLCAGEEHLASISSAHDHAMRVYLL